MKNHAERRRIAISCPYCHMRIKIALYLSKLLTANGNVVNRETVNREGYL